MNNLLILAIIVLTGVLVALYLRPQIDSENDFFPPAKNNAGVGDINYYKRKFGDA